MTETANQGSAVRPVDAAGLVLIRAPRTGPHAGEPEILIGRRPARMGFLPGIHVVPGGRVDPSDMMPSGFDDRLHPHIAHLLRGGGARRQPRTFLHAALRETFEETGLLVGKPAGPAPAGGADTPLWRAYRQAGLCPDFTGFDYLCRAITPVGSRRRFNTRFFLADGALADGSLGGDGELEDLAWRGVSAFGELTLVDVTQYVLETALRRWRERIPIGADIPKLLNYRNNIMTLSTERRARLPLAAQ